MRLRVDPIKCDGHALCAELLPELVKLDDWGYPMIKPGSIPKSLLGLAERTVKVCPTLALMLEHEKRDG
jgi:ferredoxin